MINGDYSDFMGSPTSVYTGSNDHVKVIVRGGDRKIYKSEYQANSNASDWRLINTSIQATSTPSAIAQDGTIRLFYRDQQGFSGVGYAR